MRRINKVQKILFLAITLNFLVAGLYYYLFSAIKEKNERVAIMENNATIQSVKVNMLVTAKTRVAETAEKRKALDNFFVKTDEVVAFLNLLQTLASDSSVKLKVSSVRIESINENNIFEILKLNLDASGTWRNLYRFTAQMELMPYKVSFVKVDLEKAPERAGTDKVKISAEPLWNGSFSFGVLKLK